MFRNKKKTRITNINTVLQFLTSCYAVQFQVTFMFFYEHRKPQTGRNEVCGIKDKRDRIRNQKGGIRNHMQAMGSG